MDDNAEALGIAKNLTPVIEQVADRMTDNCVRSKLYTVSSAPSNGKIGVKDAFDDNEMLVPHSVALSSASVGDAVWCIWMGSNQSTMVAMWTGDIVSSKGGATVDIANFAVLPATGIKNQIALINDVEINDVYIQSNEPSSPTEGDIWIMTGWDGNVYLEFDVAKVYLTTCRQYVSDTWVVIPEWYVYTTDWTRARLYLIQNGVITGAQAFAARKWKQTSGSSVPSGTITFTQNADNVYVYQKNTATSAGEYASSGICTQNFNAGQYSQVYIDMASSSSYASCERYIAIARYTDTYVRFSPLVYKEVTSATALTRTQTTVAITQTDDPCCVYIGMNIRNNGNTSTMYIYTLYLE